MGLDNIFQLTQHKDYSLRITMETFEGVRKRATYKNFKITENVNFHINLLSHVFHILIRGLKNVIFWYMRCVF